MKKENITYDMIKKGYEQGLVYLKVEGLCGIVCQIGEFWFYFGGLTAEEYDSVEKYKSDMDEHEIISNIYEVLDHDFKTEFSDEYLYYYWYLKENLN